ncbi:ankyrin repeat-containing domain protein [Trichoderma aethiopicum]
METRRRLSKTKSAPESLAKIARGCACEGLAPAALVEAADEENDAVKRPGIDIVHVMAVGTAKSRLSHQALLAESASVGRLRRREFVFPCNMAGLLAGDSLSQSVDALARRLLRSLARFEQHDGQQTRAIIFVSYDFGDLIVKRAICIAGTHEPQWSGIFMRATRFVFSGCFQRATSIQAHYRQVSDYLLSQSNAHWKRHVNPVSSDRLAKYALETTEAFVASKITLRSWVISLYADENGQGEMSKAFDHSTAVIGLPDEITIQEQTRKGEERFPGLGTAVCLNIEDCAVPQPWIPFEQTLVALSPAHRPLSSTSFDNSHPILQSAEHNAWTTSGGAHVLFVCSDMYNEAEEAAEQVFLSWRLERRAKKHSIRTSFPLSFAFSSRDPTRCTMKGLLSLFLYSYSAKYDIGVAGAYIGLLQDRLLLQQAWTEMDLFKSFATCWARLYKSDTLLLLRNIDECDAQSRRDFWGMLSTIAATTEVPFKIVATCRRPFALDDELSEWPDLPVSKYVPPVSVNSLREAIRDNGSDKLASILCPDGHGEAVVRQRMTQLRSTRADDLETVLRLIMDLTTWPKDLSVTALHGFCSHLQVAASAPSPADFLDTTLRHVADQHGLRWSLSWLLNAQRPLYCEELAMVLCYHRHGEDATFTTPPLGHLQEALSELQIWLRGITESHSGQVCIRENVRELLRDDSSYIWSESSSPDALLTFLIRYLTAPETRKRLEAIYDQYQLRPQSPDNGIAPPLVPDGQDFIFYAIEALPHHMTKSPGGLRALGGKLLDTNGALTSWSRAYWAMSNPFARPKSGALKTAYQTLLALGSLGPEAMSVLEKMGTEGTVLHASTESEQMESLALAIRRGNEDEALSLANRLITESKSQGQIERCAVGRGDNSDPGWLSSLLWRAVHVLSIGRWREAPLTMDSHGNGNGDEDPDPVDDASGARIDWPPSFLWRAVWLNMHRLVTVLLETGMSPDPAEGASGYFHSPMRMAARLRHHRVMDALLLHGATLDTRHLGEIGSIVAAARGGDIHGITALDLSLTQDGGPEWSLHAASLYGNWNAARQFLEAGADPNSGVVLPPDDRWAPLVVAADCGNIKTARVLLDHGADPNVCGPSGLNTPLWFAAANSGSVDMFRLLLDRGADPNHKQLKPPLLVAMVWSTVRAKDKLAMLSLLPRCSPSFSANVQDDKGATPLLYAAHSGELSVVVWLLEHEADVDATDDQGRCALHYAIAAEQVEVLRELLKWKPQLNVVTAGGRTLLEASMKNASITQMLLDAGADAELEDANLCTAINTAVLLNKTEVVRLLVDRRVNVHHRDKLGCSPIMAATGYGKDAEIVRILIKGGANLGDTGLTTGRTLLHYAMTQDATFAKILLKYRKFIDLDKGNSDGETPLIVASRNGNSECVEVLIQAGANINARDNKGWTALSHAAASPRISAMTVADLLLSQSDIMINDVGKSLETALMVACRSWKREMVKKLLAHGADPNISVVGFPSTALAATCMAWRRSRNEAVDKAEGIIRELVEHGADVNAMRGCSIFSAICVASLFASASTIELLLGLGASLEQPDPLGRLPIHFAATNGVGNFMAVATAYSGDLMACDCAGKNVLHWAAQSGHVETIKAILERVDPSGEDREEYVNRPDIDGWTPLCWAVRPSRGDPRSKLESEPREYVETVRYLIEQGARLSIRFHMQTGRRVEAFTLATMAKLCHAGVEIINLLDSSSEASPKDEAPSETDREPRLLYTYIARDIYCHICQTTIFGPVWQCRTCYDFNVCKKCFGRIDIYHDHAMLGAEEAHCFGFRNKCRLEFEADPGLVESSDDERGWDSPDEEQK